MASRKCCCGGGCFKINDGYCDSDCVAVNQTGPISGCDPSGADDPPNCSGPDISGCKAVGGSGCSGVGSLGVIMCYRADVAKWQAIVIRGLVDYNATYLGPADGSFEGTYTLDVELTGPAPAFITVSSCVGC